MGQLHVDFYMLKAGYRVECGLVHEPDSGNTIVAAAVDLSELLSEAEFGKVPESNKMTVVACEMECSWMSKAGYRVKCGLVLEADSDSTPV